MKGKEKWDAKKFEYIKDWQSFDPCDVKQVDEEDLAYLCKCANEIEAQRDDRRAEFAKAAMQGILAYGREEREIDLVAKAALKFADALIAELDKDGKA